MRYSLNFMLLFEMLMPIFCMADNGKILENLVQLVSNGHWEKATREINNLLDKPNLDFATKQQVLFQRERMNRIALDFNTSGEQVVSKMKGVIPIIDESYLERWEPYIEYLAVDGTKRYFKNAPYNVFRVHVEARELKKRFYSVPSKDEVKENLLPHIRSLISEYHATRKKFNIPKRFRITYELSIQPNVVPPLETVRVWLPFPRETERQTHIKLVLTEPRDNIVAKNSNLQRTIYLEKTAVSDQPMLFSVTFEYQSSGFYQKIDPAKVVAIQADDDSLRYFSSQRFPHIAFSDSIKELSLKIVGAEQNPYLRAQKIYAWIYQNIPWASAREYSTIECIPEYCLRHKWGDCGIQTMLFITLCRYNGIPARWESGWTTDSVYQGMHDWCQIFIAPYGWIPVDVSYGLFDSQQNEEKWFYFGNIDSYRLVVNEDYGCELYPKKIFFRSETVDFQRGEVEFSGGNLYFDNWQWNYQVQTLD